LRRLGAVGNESADNSKHSLVMKSGITTGLISVCIAALGLGLLVFVLHFKFGFKNSVAILADLITVMGVVVGGIWAYYVFVLRRFSQPKMDVQQTVRFWDSGDNFFFVRIEMTVRNIGEVLFRINKVKVYIYGMRPWPENLRLLLEKAAVSDTYKACEAELNKIYEKDVAFPDGDFLVEPGEREVLTFDFPVSNNVEMIAAYTFLYNVEGEIGWSNTSYLGFADAVLGEGVS
jgi:hypothetical protein